MTTGYPRFPAIHNDTIVFVAEDDLWSVTTAGGTARRLTAGVAAASFPRISPDGSLIAYTGAEEGPPDVHVVPTEGGETRRLTYEGGRISRVAGWDPTGEFVIYATSAHSPELLDVRLRRVSADGGVPAELTWGRATAIAQGSNGVVVLGREYWKDHAHWKRYRGGTAGQLWIDASGDGEFRKLVSLDGNLSCPHIIGDRVYFLSDHEGHGNVYSTDFDGANLRRHTDHEDFYARGLSGDGARLVYHCGGRLYLLDPAEEHPSVVDVHIPVTRTQRARRFVDAAEYLDSVDLSADASHLAVTTRGKAFTFADWEGPVTQHGEVDGVRYRLLTWLHDRERLIAAVADNGPREVLVGITADASKPPCRLDHLDTGRAGELVASPTEGKVVIANHRNELVLVDVDGEEATATVIDSSRHGEISDVVFSADGTWLAYACPESSGTDNEDENVARSTIKLLELSTGRKAVAAKRILNDFGPSFDPDGKYLYFVGQREFNPVYDSLHFDLNFPMGSRPYAVALRADVSPPFVPQPKPMHDTGEESTKDSGDDESKTDSDDTTDESLVIDLDGIENRIVPLPVSDAKYTQVLGVSGKVLVLSHPVAGRIRPHQVDDEPDGVLDSVDLETGKVERFADAVSWVMSTPDGKTVLYMSGDKMRVVKATEKAPDGADRNRESGWIDLDRLKVSVRPELEWPQMFREAWRLLSENFWVEDMSGVDWNAIYERYAPLVAQLSTRGELSDLIWEMNGELGTSHVYEALGDYRPGPHYGQGYLGADFTVDTDGAHTIAKIYTGDPWKPDATSSLLRPGVDARVGDTVVAVNGQPVGPTTSVAQLLVNQADQEVRLSLRRGEADPHVVVVRALSNEQPLRYRDWVEANRRAVYDASGGRLGYIHIPDMMTEGFAEFHRGFLNEYDRDGLVVDVRFNGGGHVSPLLLEKLARRRIGYNFSRWSRPAPYPRESPCGAMVALINESAGSDGDIFSHGFRSYNLGPLVGTRTWGGVVGYFPWRPNLADNTFLSQPEIAFHFDDAKWGVENYGVAPDIEVEYAPQDYAAGRDPQLEAGIAAALKELEKKPAHRPDPADRPKLAAPKLPPRP
ncbi:S41 family peptidase [Stackebrandtia nassauensis]|uniref:Tricorn protease homolog n=1 Tax=Stackebrandtia nassauensis (strain DSM 44728 / CIP 108903 / NRRL B-16338 / NBRC 102104 / LLR-40K-21) TaxID=446470 RepID=D3Q8U1_STANL|nr:S41 family peptidase [Stackebrandtia nassauensis]ADD44533.1 peptidase S41 [Stackebrandtia nassauensis DSM 44728]